MTTPELFQFRFSHYNEKARWALDHKGVAHRRHSYLPGLHMLPILRLSGQRSVPVLRDGERVIPGSAAIIDHLETTHPTPALYPTDPAERARALEVQRWFDDEVGALVRAAFFFEVLPDGSQAASLFTGGARPVARTAFTALFPGIRAVMRHDMGLTPERAARGLARGEEAFEFVVRHAGPDGYLVGNRFTVADLAAAALLSPAVLPAEFPYTPPPPYGPGFARWRARWTDHPGAAWVREMYRRHRGHSAEVER